MLTFFRRIRKGLLEGGSTPKYLLYAFGEIALVVIGILIALQINNWNEDKKTNATTKNYQQKIINDLIQDTIILSNLMSENRQMLIRLNSYFEFFQQQPDNLEALVDSSLNTVGLNPYNRYFPINYTFVEMQSSGQLQLLPEQVRRSMMELLNRQEYLQIIIDRVIIDSKNERYERDKYWDVHDRNFFITLGVKQERRLIQQGLLHQHNFLRHIENISNVVISRGKEIKERSAVLITQLKIRSLKD